MDLAHGVGRVYESPIPLYLYLLGAAATVLASFLIRALARGDRPLRAETQVAGPAVAQALIMVLRVLGVVFLVLMLVSGLAAREDGQTFTTLAFWVAGIVTITALSALCAGVWDATDPWATAERFYRIDGVEVEHRRLPWWVGPLLVYLLFWFELVSGVGFDTLWVLVFLLVYSLFVFTFRARAGESWRYADPLAIVFGFAEASAPLRLAPDGVYRRSILIGLDRDRPLPMPLYASVFVVLAATSYDNLSETVGWSDLLRALSLREAPEIIVGTFALLLLVVPFYATFRAAVAAARKALAPDMKGEEASRRFAWSLIPIAVAYILAHNAPLLMTGWPALVRLASDPFERGWNILGTADLWSGFAPSPQLVWFIEIALIVGGHIIAVLVAHRTAVRLAVDERAAVRSQYALTMLMSIYTIVTLWLLAQPLVS